MMKKVLLITLSIVITFAACDKKQSTTTTPTVNNPGNTQAEDSSYIINGLNDISIGGYDSANLALAITFTSGKQEKITLSVSGLPKGASVTFDNQSGIPSFAAIMRVYTKLVVGGTYPIEVTGTSESGKKKIYKINLVVADDVKCGDLIVAATNGNSSFSISDPVSNQQIWQSNLVTYGANELKIGLLMCEYISAPTHYYVAYNQDQIATITLDCNNNTVTMPSQSITAYWYSGGMQTKVYTVSGSGVIDVNTKKLVVDYTAKDPSNKSFTYKLTLDLPGL